jgi:hypothetical protein
MQAVLELIDEDMAVRKEITEEIKLQVADQLSKAIEGLKPKGAHRILYWVRDWGGAATVVTIPLALLAIVVTLGLSVTSHLESNASFQRGVRDFQRQTNARLSKIEEELDQIRAEQASEALNSLSRLSVAQFSKSLPELRRLASSTTTALKLNPESVRSISQRLRQVPESSPEYWPAVLQFIKFASAGLSPKVPPAGHPMFAFNGIRHLHIEQSFSVILLNGGELENSVLTNCRVIFTNKPVEMHNVRFINCVFEMPISSDPNQYLRHASQQLLASNFESVTISLLPAS